MKGFNSRYSRMTHVGFCFANQSKDWINPPFNGLYNFYKFYDEDDLDYYIRTNHSKYINNQQFNIPMKFRKKK